MAEPGFWNNAARSKPDIERLKVLRSRLDPLAALEKGVDDLDAMLALAREPGGEELLPEAARSGARLLGDHDRFDLQVTFTGRYDFNDAYLSVQAGTGGTESCDWARMLVRMYTRFGEREGFKVEQTDAVADDASGGIRSATLLIRGDYAYGWLQGEIGVHRLIRISPFDSNHRRQTAFASLDCVPALEQTEEPEIDLNDLRIDTYRSSGAGGQHVNVTDSAVRITHLPTGVVVSCQNERSQIQNRAKAMQILAARLAERQREEQRKELEKLSGEKQDVAFGNQIRTYTLAPYQLVKDERTRAETGNVQAVIDGDLDQFIESYLQWRRTGEGVGSS